MSEGQKQEKVLIIDPKEVHEGACRIQRSPFGEGKVAICKENGKIKIFEVEKED